MIDGVGAVLPEPTFEERKEMTPNEMAIAIGILSAALALLHGRAEYWKAKAETLEKERNDSGWMEEARFWRRVFNTEAAEAVE